MKKILSSTLAVLLIAVMVFTLVACAPKITGKFQDATASTVFQFSSNKVIVTVKGLTDVTYRGKYTITENDDGTANITFDFGKDAEKAGKWQGTMPIVRAIDTETDRRYIVLDVSGVKYKFVETYQ